MRSSTEPGPERGRHATDAEIVDLLYAAYPAWKVDWERDEPRRRAAQFSTEMRRAGLAPGARIIEIGFGGGVFLDWARSAGFEVFGVERNEAFCLSARERGHDVERGTLATLEDKDRGQADLPVCFDVLEHLTLGEITDLLTDARAFLRTNGRVVARFPNGASPFGRVWQHGDLTHKTTLSADSIGQLGALAGYRLVSTHNAARPMGSSKRWRGRAALRRCIYGLRDIVNVAICGLYFGKLMPVDANVTVVLEKTVKPRTDGD